MCLFWVCVLMFCAFGECVCECMCVCVRVCVVSVCLCVAACSFFCIRALIAAPDNSR